MGWELKEVDGAGHYDDSTTAITNEYLGGSQDSTEISWC